MNAIMDVSVADSVIKSEARCILEIVLAAAAKKNLMFLLSMASKGKCCIGGI